MAIALRDWMDMGKREIADSKAFTRTGENLEMRAKSGWVSCMRLFA